MIEKKRITFDDGRGGRRGRWEVRFKVMRTRGYPKAAAEENRQIPTELDSDQDPPKTPHDPCQRPSER